MLDIKEHNIKQCFVIEDIFNIAEGQLEYVIENEYIVKKSAKMKKLFIEQHGELKGNTMIKPFLSDVLLHSEIETNADLYKYEFKDIIEMFKALGKENIFTSNSKLMAYCRIVWAYTEWAYNEHLREDIITTKDIIGNLDVKDIIVEKMPLTKDELYDLTGKVEKQDIIIGIMGLMQGLRIKDIISIKISDLDGNNHPIDLGDRVITVDNELYDLMCEYSYVEELERGFTYGKFTSKLRDTGYLIRPLATKKNVGSNEKMSATNYTTIINTALREYDINTTDIRNYAIWNDIIDKMSIEDINKKYGVKFRYYSFAIRDEKAYNRLLDKRAKYMKNNE